MEMSTKSDTAKYLRQLIKFGTVYFYIYVCWNVCAKFLTSMCIFLLYHDYFTRFISSDRHLSGYTLVKSIYAMPSIQVFQQLCFPIYSTQN